MPILALAAIFLLVALIYSSVGFGGGSSYNALLVLAGADFQVIPAISLSCNIIVVSGGVYHFRKAGLLDMKALLPFVALSVPMAWFGGQLQIAESVFLGLLGLALLATGVQLIWSGFHHAVRKESLVLNPWLVGLPLGGVIGLLSGIVGIGGGIFLAPVLYLTAWAEPRRIAAMASGFILLNSVAGLIGHLMKQGDYSVSSAWLASWPLFVAVLAGGQIGSRLGIRMLPDALIRGLTGLLVLYVATRLLWRWAGLY